MFWPDNIVELFQEFGVLKHFDFLSVDMDSYDWFMLEKILEAGFEPRVVIIECNTMFDLKDSKTILPPILPGQSWKMWDGSSYQVYMLTYIQDSHCSSSYITALSLVESFRVLKYFHSVAGASSLMP